MSDAQAPPLVVDFGTTSSAAAVVLDGEPRIVPEPATSAPFWPSAVLADDGRLLVGTHAERRKRADPRAFRAEFKRDLGDGGPVPLGPRAYRPVELVTAVLAALRSAAGRVAGTPIGRAVLTVPATYEPGDPRRALMIAAGEAAGYPEVELLPEPVAAAHAPTTGPPLPEGSLLLVYDLGGGTFDTALIRTGPRGRHDVLGHAALDDCGGRDIDALLSGRISDDGRSWLTPLRTAAAGEPDAALRLRMGVGDLARRVKHQLSEAGTAEEFLTAATPPYRLDRPALARLVEPLLARTVDCCHRLLASRGVEPSALAAVQLVGGGSRMPAVAAAVTAAFGRPLRPTTDPDLAVVLGAAAWEAARAPRTLPADPVDLAVQPLWWRFPPGPVRLAAWQVAVGEPYAEGAVLARVRSGYRFLDLTAARAGRLTRLLAEPGAPLRSGQWLAMAAPPE